MVSPPFEGIAIGSLTPMVGNAPSWRFTLTRAGDRSAIQSNGMHWTGIECIPLQSIPMRSIALFTIGLRRVGGPAPGVP